MKIINTIEKIANLLFHEFFFIHLGMNPLQQMCHLREFFIVHHMREKEDKSVATITIPFFKAEKCLLDLTSEEKSYENLSHEVIGTSWQVISI